MNSQYFRERLDASKKRIEELDNSCSLPQINKKKRKYKEAMGYENDYNCVQEPDKGYLGRIQGINWVDAYTENLFNKLESTSATKVPSSACSNHSVR
jgi:hypothetical protein